MRISMSPFASRPLLLPIGDANGITHPAPESTKRLASIKLGLI